MPGWPSFTGPAASGARAAVSAGAAGVFFLAMVVIRPGLRGRAAIMGGKGAQRRPAAVFPGGA